MAAVDDLFQKLGEANDLMTQLADAQQRLSGYRQERQRFADLVDAAIVERDNLRASAEPVLRDLGIAIDNVYPPTP